MQQNESGKYLFSNTSIPGPSVVGRKEQHKVKHVIDGLTANSTYHVQLRANNEYGSTNWTEFDFNTADGKCPGRGGDDWHAASKDNIGLSG